jgi:hypothetical protein
VAEVEVEVEVEVVVEVEVNFRPANDAATGIQ